ncbi:serine protein kinase [Aspergillus neoniger CBS 115656]|uniref:Serine protein kinase n=1 Tax=Aspergillus neoniger (strain CBS 115656) TaxID=1448310 RepID=A0A318YC79_ASPNB|nr:serine protein kinase [Aspergillus neoniger CBS 115656]PYH31167.1 serine protein kinase [Aspergillus neoniger CBS 115656]
MRVRISSSLTRIHTISSLSSTPSRPSKHTSIPNSTLPQTPKPPHEPQYSSTINAEPLHRYTTSGYHPITLGSHLHQGRYKILHKLGWGGYSTVWAARDEQEGKYVAIKICVSENYSNRGHREMNILKSLDDAQHIVRMLDHFDVEGPNGIHPCLVLEMLGPSVSDLVEGRFADGRLPGFPYSQSGLHYTSYDNVPEDEFINLLGKPDIGYVRCNDGGRLGTGIPEYIVRPANIHSQSRPLSETIKIVDFGESFQGDGAPKTLHTPLVVRAPEVIFKDHLDYRVDLWSLGCMLFELFVGQPPFDNFLITPKILVEQMQEMAGEALPDRWVPLWESIRGENVTEAGGPGLQEWLEEMYFDSERKEDLTRDDIVELGRIIRKLLRFEPGARASVEEDLDEPCFRN